MTRDIINNSCKEIYANYNNYGIELTILISKDNIPNVYVLSHYLNDEKQNTDGCCFTSFKYMCEYFGLSIVDKDTWVGNHTLDGTEASFKLFSDGKLKYLTTEEKVADEIAVSAADTNVISESLTEEFDCSDSDEEDCYCTEMTTTHVDKDTYTTEVPPLNLSEHTMKKQAECVAKAIEGVMYKGKNTKKESGSTRKAMFESKPYTLDDFNRVVQGVDAKELTSILRIKKAVLLISPPGTGKTTTAIELAKYIEKETNSNKVMIVSFNQNTSYSDVIGGMRKVDATSDWEDVKGTLFSFSDEAVASKAAGEDSIYIYIIDEINRTNTESVLGEALTALAKRGEYVYTNNGWQLMIPDNVWIIATMNSADNSITDLDSALVDRFAIYKMPEITLDISKLGYKQKEVSGVDLVAKAIKDINELLSEHTYKGKDNQIGNRAMFTDYESTEDLILVVKYDIQPKVENKLKELTKDTQNRINNIISKLIDDLEKMI